MKIGKLKVGQIRKELADRGLDTTGNRPALMKRLREALNAETNPPPVQEPDQLPTHYPLHPRVETPPPEEQGGPDAPQPQHEQLDNPDKQQPPEAQPEQTRVIEQPRDDPSGWNPMDRKEDADGTELNAPVVSAPDRAVESGAERKQVSAAGSLARAREVSEDERLRKRRERFGAVEKPLAGSKRSQSEASEEARQLEELKAKRIAKFGPVSAPLEGTDPHVSKEERERRLKRQRRFQNVGKATPV